MKRWLMALILCMSAASGVYAASSHSALIGVDIHVPNRWTFADSTARAAATDPLTGVSYVSADVGKLAFQTSDSSYWRLATTAPTWTEVGGSTSGLLVAANNLSDVASAATALGNLNGLSASGGICGQISIGQANSKAITGLNSVQGRNGMGFAIGGQSESSIFFQSPISFNNKVVTSANTIQFNGGGSGTVTVGVPATAGTTTFTFPGSNGTLNYPLVTDGSGNTSWSASIAANASTATMLATPRSIYGSNFDGSAALTGPVGIAYGGTGATTLAGAGIVTSATTAGGDLSGTYPSPTVNKVSSVALTASNNLALFGPTTANKFADNLGGIGNTMVDNTVRMNIASGNVLAIQNMNAGGYSAARFIEDTGQERGAVGFGNSGVSLYQSEVYLESFSPTSTRIPIHICQTYNITGHDYRLYFDANGLEHHYAPSSGDCLTTSVTGQIGFNKTSPTAQADVVPFTASTVGLRVTGAISQSANLIECKNNGGTGVFAVDQGGNVTSVTISGGSVQSTGNVFVGTDYGVYWNNIGYTGVKATVQGVVHVFTPGQGTAIQFDTCAATPSVTLPAGGSMEYIKGGKKVIAYNNAGTMAYFYLDLTQVGTALWTNNGATPP